MLDRSSSQAPEERSSTNPTRRPSKDAAVYRCKTCQLLSNTRSQSLPERCVRCFSKQLEWIFK
jgi:hypothetical protein